MPIILTISCAKDRGAKQQAVRDTWLHLSNGWPFDHKFLLGRGNTDPEYDEWIVDADDSYGGITEKLRASYRNSDDCDWMFVSCIDTYIVPFRIMQSGYRHHDFSGRQCDGSFHASGGNGYWLSKQARQFLSKQPHFPAYSDLLDSQQLIQGGYPLHHDPGYGTSITKHLSRGTDVYEAKWMYETHKKFMEQPL